MSFIEMKNICKKYAGADKNSVTDFSLSVEEGEFIAFVGPSGCGKSTTLRMIAGFEEITSGDFYIDGKRMNAVLPRDRGISMVFQNYALYPHMTVEKNISYGLKNMKVPAAEIKKKVDWAIDILGLSEYRYRKPKNLSGGQRQRVALGRAIVKDQKLFLMDEPLSNLDAKLRVEMRSVIRHTQKSVGITTVYVTHDQDEALSMSDIIAVMRRGRIEQIGSPWEIYFRPATRFVADFVGTVNFLEGTAHREADGSLSVDHRGMRLRVDEDTDLQGGEPVTLVVRPEGISLMGLEETVPEGTALRGTIENYSFLGRMIRYWVRVGEEVFVIDDANVDLTGARTGDVQLRLDTRKLHVLKGGGADAAG